MEKLELKHIVGYLPYGLKVQLLDRKEFTKIIVVGCTNKGILRTGDSGHYNWEVYFNKIKPILRPLSDLTKEIEVNGEKFVPIEELSHYAIQQTDNGVSGLEWGIVSTFPYRDIQKLYEWRFDIHDLIGKGLAIDINTLTK